MVYWIDERLPLPRPETVPEEVPGLVAAGGSLTVERLEQAYHQGLFPWYGPNQPVLWWSPDPRMVLPVAEFRLSHSLKKTIRRFLRTPGCEIRFDHDLGAVIDACASTPRDGQDGTWIVPAMRQAYVAWGAQGRVHSVETWVDGRLVGGLYGVQIGRMAWGESMFAHATDASKIALAALVAFCRRHRIAWIDCQQNTRHLASLGAREVPRDAFLAHVQASTRGPGAGQPLAWTYDAADWALLLDAPARPRA